MIKNSFRFVTLLLMGTFVAPTVNAQDDGTDFIEVGGQKTFQVEFDIDDQEPQTAEILFNEYQQVIVEGDDYRQQGYYYFEDGLLALSLTDSDGNNVELHLSYDLLDADEVSGTIEDVTLIYHSYPYEYTLESYMTYRDALLGYDYTLTLTNEVPSHTGLLLKEPDERIDEMKNETFILSADGFDDTIFFDTLNGLWLDTGTILESNFMQAGLYTFEADDLVFYMGNFYENGLVKFTLTHDQIEDESIEGTITDLEFISFDGDTPDDFEEQREYTVDQPFQLMKQVMTDLTGHTETFYLVEDGEPVNITFEADGVAQVEYLGETFTGTFEFGMTNLQIHVDEDGVTTTLYVEDETLSRQDSQQVHPDDRQVIISDVTHKLTSDVPDETLENFESIFQSNHEIGTD